MFFWFHLSTILYLLYLYFFFLIEQLIVCHNVTRFIQEWHRMICCEKLNHCKTNLEADWSTYSIQTYNIRSSGDSLHKPRQNFWS